MDDTLPEELGNTRRKKNTAKKAISELIYLQRKSYPPEFSRYLFLQPAVFYKVYLSWNYQPRCLTRGNRVLSTVNPRSNGSSKRIQAINSYHIVYYRKDRGVRIANPQKERVFLYMNGKAAELFCTPLGQSLVAWTKQKHKYGLNKAFPLSMKGPWSLNKQTCAAQLPKTKLPHRLALLLLYTAAEISHHRWVKTKWPTPWTKPILTQSAKSEAGQVWIKTLVPHLTTETQQTQVFHLSYLQHKKVAQVKQPWKTRRRVQTHPQNSALLSVRNWEWDFKPESENSHLICRIPMKKKKFLSPPTPRCWYVLTRPTSHTPPPQEKR